ncbi:MAG: tRNA lysidine(34) synthetase TilS [Methylophilaceae bacterium 17-44-8]|nr:MAG: tRNA lysidine(34) synthetase TilS [Methylophilaceae bacterium 17-44-8]
MASSKLPPPNKTNLITRVNQYFTRVFLSKPQPSYHVLLAYSGGLDSSVLLHMMVSLQQQWQAEKKTEFQLTLSAMHVHHGLNAKADSWVTHCQQVCAQYAIPLQVEYVQVDKHTGLGVEATARHARYAALQQSPADFICLAHHQDDQAETLMLQLMRGSGVKGLAAMAEMDVTQRLIRPLLTISRQALEQYANAHALQWIEDDSNQNTDFDRNFMRHQVLPLLETHYPSVHKILSRTAKHLAEANDLLTELAQLDGAPMLVNGVHGYQRCLDLSKLAALNEIRAKNAVRWWLDCHELMMPNAEVLAQLMQQLLHARADAGIHIQVAKEVHVKRYLDVAYVVKEGAVTQPINQLWQGESRLQLTSQDSLVFETSLGQGIAQKKLMNTALRIRSREGSERFRPEVGRPSRTLKHILQTHHIPPWLRARVPLVFVDETLVYIPNVGVDASMAAQPNEMGTVIRWEHHP